jgi:hypothetical protein
MKDVGVGILIFRIQQHDSATNMTGTQCGGK